MLDWLLSNVYELCIGLGLILTTIFNRRKPTTEETKAKQEAKALKIEEKASKLLSKVKDNYEKAEELRNNSEVK